jgi:hypothetical protein
MAVTSVTDGCRIQPYVHHAKQRFSEEGPMRNAHTAERWSQPPIVRNLVVTLALALVWMVAVAATN